MKLVALTFLLIYGAFNAAWFFGGGLLQLARWAWRRAKRRRRAREQRQMDRWVVEQLLESVKEGA